MSTRNGWLLRDGKVLAAAEIAVSTRARVRGARGRDGLAGVLVLAPCRQVHSFGVRFALDVAFCAGDGTVLRIATLEPRRLSAPSFRARFAVEAPAGAFQRWGLETGQVLEVRG